MRFGFAALPADRKGRRVWDRQAGREGDEGEEAGQSGLPPIIVAARGEAEGSFWKVSGG
jgi:hypothetical protein